MLLTSPFGVAQLERAIDLQGKYVRCVNSDDARFPVGSSILSWRAAETPSKNRSEILAGGESAIKSRISDPG